MTVMLNFPSFRGGNDIKDTGQTQVYGPTLTSSFHLEIESSLNDMIALNKILSLETAISFQSNNSTNRLEHLDEKGNATNLGYV